MSTRAGGQIFNHRAWLLVVPVPWPADPGGKINRFRAGPASRSVPGLITVGDQNALCAKLVGSSGSALPRDSRICLDGVGEVRPIHRLVRIETSGSHGLLDVRGRHVPSVPGPVMPSPEPIRFARGVYRSPVGLSRDFPRTCSRCSPWPSGWSASLLRWPGSGQIAASVPLLNRWNPRQKWRRVPGAPGSVRCRSRRPGVFLGRVDLRDHGPASTSPLAVISIVALEAEHAA